MIGGFQRALLPLLAAFGACSPLVRVGDIEPPQGRQTLVEVRITADDKEGPPADVLGASSHQAFRDALLVPTATVDAGTVASEMAADVQGADATAQEAAVDMPELATDARRVESMYAARGYFRARTLAWKVVDRGNRTARLELMVAEGPATHISHIELAGITDTKGADAEMDRRLKEIEDELGDLILFEEGDVWDEDRYLRSLDRVQRAFRDQGFIHCTVTGDNWVSREKHLVAVWFNIDHGPLVRAQGAPVIVGQHHIPKRRIQDRVPIDDGEILEAKLLRETEQQVYELGAFFSVQARPVRTRDEGHEIEMKPGGGDKPSGGEVPSNTPLLPAEGTTPAPLPSTEPSKPGEPPPTGPERRPATPDDTTARPIETTPAPTGGDPMPPEGGDDEALDTEPAEVLLDRVPVEVSVQEASPWDFTLGPAALTDSTKLELSLPMAFTFRNLFDEVIGLRANLKPALVFPDFWVGEDCCSTGDWALAGQLGLEVPSFFEQFLRLSIQASYERDVAQETKKEELSGRAALSRRLGAGFTASFGYDVSRVHYFEGTALTNISAELGKKFADFRFRETDFVAWLGGALIYDIRDGIYDARRGAYASLTLDYGDSWTGSAIQFFRGALEVRGYITLDALPWFTVAMRAKVGGLVYPQGQGTPESIRFKSGGPTTNRGFSSNHMGDYICGDNEAHKHDPSAALNDPECGQAATDRVYVGGNYLIEGNVELRFQPGSLGFVAFMDVGRLWSRWEDVDLGQLFVTVGPGLRISTPVGPIRFDLGLLLGEHRDRVFQFSLGQAF